jgi:hypothetical protein
VANENAAEMLVDLASSVKTRLHEDAERARRGEGLHSPLSGAMFFGGRPYGFLTDGELARLGEIDAQLQWSEQARRHFTDRYRRDVVERLLADEVRGENEGALSERIAESMGRLESALERYTFLLPLDNVEVEPDSQIRVGPAILRRLSADDWKRYCEEVYRMTAKMEATDADKGATAANWLSYASVLLPIREDEKKPVAVIEAIAWGSPESAYQTAREHAHFAIAALKLFTRPFDERGHQIASLYGENVQRERGWRVRFAQGHVRPWLWHDGTGPGFTFKPDPPAKWSEGTTRFMGSLNRLLDSSQRTEAARRVLTAIYWTGTSLNQPTLTDVQPVPNPETAKPTGVEIGRRIRDLVTATSALFKRHGKPRDGGDAGDRDAMNRLGEAVRSLEPNGKTWADSHWNSVMLAYDARNQWTHEGIGTTERAGAETLCAALQAIIPLMVIDAAEGRIVSNEDAIGWRPSPQRG